MGIFDYVRCRYPLPHYQDAEFQTKDVARIVDPGDPVDGLLDQYVITKTGGRGRDVRTQREARKPLAASDTSSDIAPAKPETAGKRTRTDANGVSG